MNKRENEQVEPQLTNYFRFSGGRGPCCDYSILLKIRLRSTLQLHSAMKKQITAGYFHPRFTQGSCSCKFSSIVRCFYMVRSRSILGYLDMLTKHYILPMKKGETSIDRCMNVK
uniref:Uncharacterized protein n=1 Tax=Setaria viridis TaxID=4556 RepID=A0A4U6TFQ2_SETVI|nr:hypothetical protein SEVIR_8G154300v2 [Setaria viridis]